MRRHLQRKQNTSASVSAQNNASGSKNLLNELNFNIRSININVDNKATIFISNNDLVNQKCKHIGIRFHYIRELIKNKEIELKHIKSQENIADGLTKYLNGPSMTIFRNKIQAELK